PPLDPAGQWPAAAQWAAPHAAEADCRYSGGLSALGGSPRKTLTALRSPFMARLASMETRASSGKSSGLISFAPFQNFVFFVRFKVRIWSSPASITTCFLSIERSFPRRLTSGVAPLGTPLFGPGERGRRARPY